MEHMSWCSGRHSHDGECEQAETLWDGVEIALVASPGADVTLWVGELELTSVADIDLVVAKLADYRRRLTAALLETRSDA